MAIEWTEATLQLINFQRREVRLTCTVKDDDPETGSTRTYTQSGLADTGPNKIALLDAIWRAYQVDLAKDANKTTVVADLEPLVIDNLNGRLS